MIRHLALALILLLPLASHAETRRPSHCIAIADAAPEMSYVHKASFGQALQRDIIRLSYIAHASFLLETAGGLNIVTDYTGFIGSTQVIPDVVTMNHAHDTHWTAHPDPAIPHVLPGWGPFGVGITHRLEIDDILIRNVSTDIRTPDGGVEENGNSIFVFEVAGLCVGHLGHLHQEPSPHQYAALGRLDVVMAPVDGGMTLDLGTMTRVLKRLRSSVVIPMHWFSDGGLGLFLNGMKDSFAIDRRSESFIELSARTLPNRPTIVVLQPRWLRDLE